MNDLSPIVIDPARSVRQIIEDNALVGEQRSGPQRFWTMREMKILRENYPMGGAEGCVALLPGRSAHAIYGQALKAKLKRLKADGQPPRTRQRWAWSEQQDAAILRVYHGKPARGAVKALARTLGRPLHAVARRALEIGCTLPRFKEPNWTDAEIEILRRLGPTAKPTNIRYQLKLAGFQRTATAIKVKLTRLLIAREMDDDHYTGRGLALALGIDRKRVGTFVERGWLKARKDRVSPGKLADGNWSIHRRDVRNFIINNVAIIDFAKVDKFWLVDLLVGDATIDRREGKGE